MPHGETHAKDALLREARSLAKALGNGSASNLETQGNAIGIILTLLEPIVKAELVTTDELEDRLISYRAECPVHCKYVKSQEQKFKIGPITLPGALSAIGMTAMLFAYLIGHGMGLW